MVSRTRLSVATEHIFDTRTQSYWSFTAVIVIPTGHVLIRAVSNGQSGTGRECFEFFKTIILQSWVSPHTYPSPAVVLLQSRPISLAGTDAYGVLPQSHRFVLLSYWFVMMRTAFDLSSARFIVVSIYFALHVYILHVLYGHSILDSFMVNSVYRYEPVLLKAMGLIDFVLSRNEIRVTSC